MKDELDMSEDHSKSQSVLDKINQNLPSLKSKDGGKVLFAVTPSKHDPFMGDVTTSEGVGYSLYDTIEHELGLYPNNVLVINPMETDPYYVPHREPRTMRDIMFNKRQCRSKRRSHKSNKFGN